MAGRAPGYGGGCCDAASTRCQDDPSGGPGPGAASGTCGWAWPAHRGSSSGRRGRSGPSWTPADPVAMLRPHALVLLSSTSIQFGTGVAVTAFAAAGPLGAVWLRGVAAALIMVAWVRPRVRGLSAEQVRAVVPYALTLAAMLAAVYLALAEAPLGAIAAILMLGPLTVSAWGSRGLVDLVAVAIAAAGVGVLTLSKGASGSISPIGIVLALAAATAFGAYIHTGKAAAREFDGLTGVAIARLLVAVLHTPLGLAVGHDGQWDR